MRADPPVTRGRNLVYYASLLWAELKLEKKYPALTVCFDNYRNIIIMLHLDIKIIAWNT